MENLLKAESKMSFFICNNSYRLLTYRAAVLIRVYFTRYHLSLLLLLQGCKFIVILIQNVVQGCKLLCLGRYWQRCWEENTLLLFL